MKHPPPVSIESTFQRAIAQHQAGRLADADALCRQVLQARPDHADGLHLLGVIALQRGHLDAAVDLIGRSVRSRPSEHNCCNLGNALKHQGRRSEAIAAFRRALGINPDSADALCNLGHALLEQGDVDDAVAACSRAIEVRPDFAEAHCNLGNARLAQGRLDDAIRSYRRTLAIRPALAIAHDNLGHALSLQGRSDEAIEACRHALRLQPDLATAHGHLGDALRAQGRPAEALDCYRAASGLEPGSAEWQVGMGRALQPLGRWDEAIQCHVAALAASDRGPIRLAFVQSIATAHFLSPQPQVRELLIRALEEVWVDPGELLTPATSLVEAGPAVKDGLARMKSSARLEPALIEAIAADRLLTGLLRSDAVNSIALERLLTRMRRQMLDDVLSNAPPAGDATWLLHAAIARQCFLNEYVYACSDDESRQLALLRERLDDGAARGERPDARGLVAFASYEALSGLSVAAAWAQAPGPAEMVDLFNQQVVEPGIERGLRDGIPRLTGVDDRVSSRVQAQYEAHPYPRWLHAPRRAVPTDIDSFIRRRFPLAPFQPLARPGPLEVLVAGCGTGQHPIRVAQQLTNARILAVDLSLASLSYAKRKTAEIGEVGIDYAQADILQLGAIDELRQRFDLIECAGVLHHLADPVAGWRVLVDLLRPGGLMQVALYSEPGRRDVVAARRRLQGQALPETASDIRHRRQQLMDDELAPQFRQFLSSRDFYTTSACRDLLFHVQEHRFTLPQLERVLAQLGLTLIGLATDPEVGAAYARQFPDDPAQTNLAHWHAFESARPDTFSRMYQFWVQKPGG